ncbi:YbaB/EbfC family nucleoid-associated protein [Pedococcus soli]
MTEGNSAQDRRSSRDLETSLRQIDEDIAGAHDRAAKADAWVHEVERITGTGTAERGGVRVEVDLQGMVTGLSVTDAVAARGGQTVAYAVLSATAQAQDEVRRKAAESSAATWGADSAATRHFAGEVAADNVTAHPDAPPAGPRDTRGGTW